MRRGLQRVGCVALVGWALAWAGAKEVRASYLDLLVTTLTSPTGNAVQQFDRVTGASKGNFASDPAVLFPRGIAVNVNGNVLVGDIGTNSIHAFDGITGAQLPEFVPKGSGGISQPWGLTFRGGNCGGGNLFEACYSSNRILEFDGVTGAYVGDFVTAGLGGVTNPTGIIFAPTTAGVHAGNLFVASSGDNRILEFNGTTGAFVGSFVTGGLLGAPAQIQFGADGTLYVANFTTSTITRYGTSASNGGDGVLLTPTGISGGGLNGASGLVIDDTGGILVTSYFTNQVLRYKVDGSNPNGYSFDRVFATTLNSPVYLTLCPVPEPAGFALLGMGVACLSGLVARRRLAAAP